MKKYIVGVYSVKAVAGIFDSLDEAKVLLDFLIGLARIFGQANRHAIYTKEEWTIGFTPFITKTAVEEKCATCDRIMVNADPEQQGQCRVCWQKYEEHCTPKLSTKDKFILKTLKLLGGEWKQRHVVTSGFDPYAGDQYTLKIFGLELLFSNVISTTLSISGKHFLKKEYSGFSYNDEDWQYKIFFKPIHEALEQENLVWEANTPEDPMGPLSWYE